MQEMQSEITDDCRISENMRRFMVANIEINPMNVLGIVILLSLFCAGDQDTNFFTDFESHFLPVDMQTSLSRSEQLPDMSIITALMKVISQSNIPNQKIEIIYDGEWMATIPIRLR